MSNVINLVIKAVIIYVGAYLFPEYVVCKNVRTLIFAILIMLLTGFIFSLITLITLVETSVKYNCSGIGSITFAFLMGIVSTFSQLIIPSVFLNGFKIHGIITYIILALLFIFCSFPSTTKN